ncbi:MAG: ABC transporter ATP-binding protein [Lacisediminihabitans sp.]
MTKSSAKSSANTKRTPAAGDLDVVLSGVGHSYVTDSGDHVQAVGATDLRIEPGEFVCVVGPSGCGKTTLLQILAGFITPSEGSVTVGGTPVTRPSYERGVMFQQPNLYPWLSVRKNVEFGPRLLGVSATERRNIAEKYLTMVGLSTFMDRKPYELSGGMQQRCQIARVLANDPEIILMDEPFGALDAMTRERLQVELLQIWQQRKKTVFFITHSVEEAIFLGTRVLVMSARPGTIILDRPVRISAEYGDETMGAELRSTPEFIALRDKVSATIYEAQGAVPTPGVNH